MAMYINGELLAPALGNIEEIINPSTEQVGRVLEQLRSERK
jgi:hypothetical protein